MVGVALKKNEKEKAGGIYLVDDETFQILQSRKGKTGRPKGAKNKQKNSELSSLNKKCFRLQHRQLVQYNIHFNHISIESVCCNMLVTFKLRFSINPSLHANNVKISIARIMEFDNTNGLIEAFSFIILPKK